MTRIGFKSVVYHADVYLGELETVPVNGNFQFPHNEIQIHHITPSSERCHPLSVLLTVSSASFRCKLEPGNSSSTPEQSPLINLHSFFFYDLMFANVVPVLCVARNVACNFRCGFFKEFDENLLRKISEIFYEDEIVNLPCSPDVSNFLISEDDDFVPYGNPSIPIADGPKVAQRLDEKNVLNVVSNHMANYFESKPESFKLQAVPVASAAAPTHTRIVLSSQEIISDMLSGKEVLTNADVPLFGNESSFFGTHPIPSLAPVNHAEKPEKFKGLNSKWNGFDPNVAKANIIEHGQNSEGNKRFNTSGRGAKLRRKRGVSNKQNTRKCYNCGGKGHKASDCK